MRIASRVINIVLCLEIFLIAVLAFMTILPAAFSVKPSVVISPSMQPTMPVGSMAYVDQNISGRTTIVGDIVAFDIGSNAAVEWCTHRVVGTDDATGQLITQGDANDAADIAPLPRESVRGRVIASVPQLGYVAMFAAEHRLAIVLCVMATAVGAFVLSHFEHRQKLQ